MNLTHLIGKEPYRDNGEPTSCQFCASTDFKHVGIYWEERYPVEYAIHCEACDAFLAYFAYGNYERRHPSEDRPY